MSGNSPGGPLRTALFVLHVLVSTAALGLLAHLVGLPSRSKRLVCRVARLWSALLLAAAGARVEGTLPAGLDPDRPYVFVSNHLSHLDVPSLFVTLRRQLSFMAKRSLLWLPVFGTAILSVGVVVVDRRHRDRARASVDRAARLVAAGRSVFVFPEGQRSRDGRMGELKKGAFILAIRAQVPLVPVRIEGSRDVLPRGSIRPRPGTIRVTVLPPISTAGMSIDDRDALRERARAAIAGGAA